MEHRTVHNIQCRCTSCALWFSERHSTGLCVRCQEPLDTHALVGKPEPVCLVTA